jgi:hypothetical protein
MLIRETFAANVAKAFNHPGSFFRVKRVTGFSAESLSCVFFKNGKRLDVDLLYADPGDFAIVPDGFDRVEIGSTVAQDVTVQIARGRIGTDRVTGEVLAISQDMQLSLNALSFIGVQDQVALAGTTCPIQLWNPAASPRRLVVSKVWMLARTGIAHYLTLGRSVAALTDLAAIQPSNKFSGGVATVGELRYTVVGGGSPGSLMGIFALDVLNKSFPMKFEQPYVIAPGFGLTVCPAIINQASCVTFDYFEQVI